MHDGILERKAKEIVAGYGNCPAEGMRAYRSVYTYHLTGGQRTRMYQILQNFYGDLVGIEKLSDLALCNLFIVIFQK